MPTNVRYFLDIPEDYITKGRLTKKRGWSDELIQKYLKKPDLEMVHPVFKNKISLYLWGKVDLYEKVPEIKEIVEANRAKQKARKLNRAKEHREPPSFAQARDIRIHIEAMRVSSLIKKAIRKHNDGTPNAKIDDSHSAIVRQRLAVDYAYDHLVSYDPPMESLSGKLGAEQARLMLMKRTYDAIRAQYPSLEDASREAERRRKHREFSSPLTVSI